ncbi:Nucleoside-triphosphatase [Candidatus Protochlamydia naegleriophila]|uniref:dITP/XTP pyrophosphatase n=1 Tax=Candidatus Protochlamydia naegleriophila TaxID=389348 RepID=A0A0U5EP40_9BACT|nr:RdgB/HAM1 family non-canonical purine NTP pyrophosphatase [Candidatus Protochlamydia naegleriophila]CUI15712.1 Nucleoside-triphosphatase [Candidatus Protochlamydia naegleriophila]
MEILLATTNLHKIREFREMCKPFSHLEILSLHQFPSYIAPVETGKTFKENAILKAEHAAKQLNVWAIADDSGLVVPFLQGQPGIYSRRYAGPEACDADNRKKLLQEMARLTTQEDRSAYYECCLAVANSSGLKKCVQGVCEGFILTEAKGRYGFGYDSLFVKNDYEKTFAELDETIKNRISHRRKAFERLAAFLENLRG